MHSRLEQSCRFLRVSSPLNGSTSKFSLHNMIVNHPKSSLVENTPNEIRMREDVMNMVRKAIEAVNPYNAVRNRVGLERIKTINSSASSEVSCALVAQAAPDRERQLVYDLSKYDDIKIFSFGKASAAMAIAASEIAKEASSLRRIKIGGVVIIKDGHASADELKKLESCSISVRSASHPLPDARSVAGANEILLSASASDSRTLVIACISGGGSALFCSPRDPLSLDDLINTNFAMLQSGMPIEKMNVIRKRLENGKGGKLAAVSYPATVLTLVLSDIIGDPLDLIASGPTVPDDSSGWIDACQIVAEYGLDEGGSHELPSSVLELLRMGRDGAIEDNPKSNHPAFSVNDSAGILYSESVLVGNNHAAVMAAADEAEKLGYNPVVIGTRVEGEASDIAGVYISMAEMLSRQRGLAVGKNQKYKIGQLPVALIAGGETTVTLEANSNGKGGRNQELTLSAAIKMHEMCLRDVVLASVGTDGTDGPTDAAGAVVDSGTINRIEGIPFENTPVLRAKDALRNHDAYSFFNSANDGSLIKTGPTGTNVADICITLVC